MEIWAHGFICGMIVLSVVACLNSMGENDNKKKKRGGKNMSIYTENGYKNRRDYLDSMAEEFGVDRETVYALASVLGSSEDFDGLICELEDLEMFD